MPYEDERLWKFQWPAWASGVWARNSGVYASGALFSLAFYVMLDAAVWSKSTANGSDVHVTFVDWLPLICSSMGMLIINSVEKARLSSDGIGYSGLGMGGGGGGVAWQARVVLFLGFASLAGGMAGGVCIFVLKFVVPSVGMPMLGMGIENVVANGLVGLSSVVLWISQNMEDEYAYNLAL
ncbi:Vacuolar protein sorting-associated protein 68 [Sporothrix epigloea]|uniref:Vacuolar protein sorting-associated protein 68 n=1 Tax=Sporothrix epigloea TaxID=1892477 RepID=A0ABP0DZG3_9PEZI